VKIRRGRHARVDTYAGLNMRVYLQIHVYEYVCADLYPDACV